MRLISIYTADINIKAAVISKLINVTGRQTFQPKFITWSYLGRNNEPRAKTNIVMKNKVLIINQNAGGKMVKPRFKGASQPPKNKQVINAEISTTLTYSPMKNIPNFIPEYST